jgi:predicted ribosome quality control (RQC) complex YloA/Tae2 family protein
LQKLFPTFGKEINQYLQGQNILKLEEAAKWDLIQSTIKQMESGEYFIIQPETEPEFSLLPPVKSDTPFLVRREPMQAITEYFYAFSRLDSLSSEKTEALKDLQKRIKQSQSYLDKNYERLLTLEDSKKNEENANILMANLHQIPAGLSSIELYDFYNDAPRIIKLKKELNAQKNAENYYRKAKNEKIELDTLQKNIRRKENEQNELKIHIEKINSINSLKELRKYLKDNHLEKKSTEKTPEHQLFKKFKYQGWDIWVGKNAKNNDLLTVQHAHKEDLWLHAKDVSGSHVIIKHQSGKTFPTDVIEKAASLAAYYSKRSTDSLCPVIVTPKKFVRKTKDLAPGQVIVEKEEVIMVVPEKF